MKFTRNAPLLLLLLGFGSSAYAEKNWGKWGAEDQIGTLNYITPEVRKNAARSVKSGKVFNLAIDLKANQPGWPGRSFRHGFNYILHGLAEDGGGVGVSDDHAFLDLQVSTQWDGFPHFFYDRTLYNNTPSSVVSAGGASKLSIHLWADHLATRGVLLDIARYKGKEFLEKGYVISAADLEGAAAKQNVDVRSGDCLMIRTGWINQLFEHQWPMKDYAEAIAFGEPGVGYEATQWLQEKEIACIALDNLGVEPIPFDPLGIEKVTPKGGWPIHIELLRNQGMPIGELFTFEALATDCAADGQYDFMFTAPPLRVVGGVGSPLSPMALK